MTGDAGEFEGFEWDPAKDERTHERRGIDFDKASRVFDSDYFQKPDTRRDYGEPRFLTIGEVDGAILSVVWTPRGLRRRIISVWPASNRERREYRDHRQIHE